MQIYKENRPEDSIDFTQLITSILKSTAAENLPEKYPVILGKLL